jgi:hypothetical protein
VFSNLDGESGEIQSVLTPTPDPSPRRGEGSALAVAADARIHKWIGSWSSIVGYDWVQRRFEC